jgi:hypothetical protein
MRARSFSRTIETRNRSHTLKGSVLLEPPDRQGRPLVAAFRLNGSMRSRGGGVLSFFVLFIGSAQRGIEPAMDRCPDGTEARNGAVSPAGVLCCHERGRLWTLGALANSDGRRSSNRVLQAVPAGSAAQVDIATAGDGSALSEGGPPSQRSIRAALVLSRSAAGRGNSVAPAPGAEDGAGALAERDRRTGRDDPIATLDRAAAVVVEADDSPAPG